MSNLNRFDEFKKLVNPVCEWLKLNGNPYTYVIISTESAKIVEDILGLPIANNLK